MTCYRQTKLILRLTQVNTAATALTPLPYSSLPYPALPFFALLCPALSSSALLGPVYSPSQNSTQQLCHLAC